MSNLSNAPLKFQFAWIYCFSVNEDYPADVLADVDQVSRYKSIEIDYVVKIRANDPDVTHDIHRKELGLYAFIGKVRTGHGIFFLTKSESGFENLAFYDHNFREVTMSHHLYAQSNLKRLLNENEVHLLSVELIISAYFDKLKI